MKSTQDYLTTALLITLILFLVYLLYRRLLVVLGKQEQAPQYVNFMDEMLEIKEDSVKFGVEVPEETHVKLMVEAEDGSIQLTLHDDVLTAGNHDFLFTRDGLNHGRYVFICQTENQRAERYVRLD